MQDNFEFNLISNFAGYESARDKTNIAFNFLVRGSVNVYKKLSGTIANRFGLKRRGSADATIAGVDSSWEWNTSFAKVRPLRVSNSKLQVESDIVASGTYVWYDLLTALTTSRFVFDAWYNATEAKDQLVFVKGTSDLLSWSGGIAALASATANSITVAGTDTLAQDGFNGSSNMVLTINSVDYGYTARGVSPSPSISNTSTNATPALSTTSRHGQKFTTGASATQILSATARVKVTTGGSTDAKFTGAIYTDNAGVPGTLIQNSTAIIAGAFSTGDFDLSFTFNGLTATPLTVYHFVLYQQSGPGVFDVYIGNTPAVGTNISTDSGATWSAENGYLYATVNENIVSAQTFVGVTPNPSALLVNSVILQKVVTNGSTPSDAFRNDFLKVIDNQVQIGSYLSPLGYVSSATDYTNYTVPTSRIKGNPDLLTFDNPLTGISERQGKAVFSAGTKDWYVITRNQITVGSTLIESVAVEKLPTAELEAALAHEFIDTVGDDIVYLSVDQQIKILGTVRNFINPRFPVLSLPIRDELKEEDFTGGHLRAVGDYIFITAPVGGRDYVHETRQEIDRSGNVVSDKFWHAPYIRNISRIAVISGVIFGHSNSNPQIYQLLDTDQWHDDSPTDENLPYECRMRMAYRRINTKTGERRQGKTTFDKVYYEGYMTEGSIVCSAVYMEYQGSKDIQSPYINNPTGGVNARFYTGADAPSIGDASLGDNPLGDGLVVLANDQESLPKFRKITKIYTADVFEYELEVFSIDVDSRWEILCLGADEIMSEVNAVEIMKK